MQSRFVYVPSGDRQLATSLDLPPQLPKGRRVPTVIVLHGLTGQRLGRSYHLVELGRTLAEAGIACVRFDQSGCGESTGTFEDLSPLRMAEDAQAVHHWLREQPWCEAPMLGLIGVSLGALPAVALDAAVPNRALALWGPVYDLPSVFKHVATSAAKSLLDEQGWVPYRGLPIGRTFVEQVGAIRPVELLAAGASPMLIMHAQDDETVPVSEGKAYASRCRELDRLCQLVTPRTGGHDFFEYPDRRKLLDTTVDFFTRQLAPNRR